jgi:hypothetical protein
MSRAAHTLVDSPARRKPERKSTPHDDVARNRRSHELTQLRPAESALDRQQSVVHRHRMKSQRRSDRAEERRGDGIALELADDNAYTRYPIQLGNQDARSLIIEVVQNL